MVRLLKLTEHTVQDKSSTLKEQGTSHQEPDTHIKHISDLCRLVVQ